jgi:type IV pilus assembly protein PilA
MVSRRHEHGFTLIELLIVVAIIAIIAAIAIPGLLRARMASSETSAIETLRAIGTAQ